MVRPPKFHTKPLRRHRPLQWRKSGTLAGLVVVAVLVFFVMRMPVVGGDWNGIETGFSLCGERDSFGCVIDGDTIMLGTRKVRMAGYNAPEMDGQCAAETALARQSRDALRDWLNEGLFEMDGGLEPPRDQYGRELRNFRRDDEWLSDWMIERELAQGSGWGLPRGGWCD